MLLKMSTGCKYSIFATALIVIFVLLSYIIFVLLGEAGLIISLGMALAILLAFMIIIYMKLLRWTNERTENHANRIFFEIHSLLNIYSTLKINHPLMHMGTWPRINPTFGDILIEKILSNKPDCILELGSGVSTILAAYALKKLGKGRIISFEDDEKFVEIHRNHLIKHGLQDIASIIHAPMKELEMDGKKWLWYDTTPLKQIRTIDMLIVDGPESQEQRYPALPVLFESLSADAAIVVHDYKTEDMKNTVALWLKKFNCFEPEIFFREYGGFAVLSRVK